MTLGWGTRRKLLYSTVAIVVGLVALALIYQYLFTAAATCFDSKQNGTERGVDCGGSCSLICTQDAHAPVVLWARSFQTSPGSYTAAAYIKNSNVGAGARRVAYSFQLFDAQNSLIVERDGVADLPPLATIPIIEPNVTAQNRVVARTLFAFSTAPTWSKISSSPFQKLLLSNEQLSADGSTLSATVENKAPTDANQVTVAAVVFDSSGVAIAASKSLLATVPAQSSQPVVFTWPLGNPDAARAEITILPSF